MCANHSALPCPLNTILRHLCLCLAVQFLSMLQEYDFNRPLLVNAEMLLGAREAAEFLGMDISDALASAGIRRTVLHNPKGYLAYHQVARFLEQVAAECDCPLFGYYVGRYQPPLRFGLMSQLPRLCSSVRDSIEKTLRVSQVYSQESRWELECEQGYAFMKRYHRVSYPGPQRQLHLLAVTLMVKASVFIGDDEGLLKGVYFSFSEPRGADELSRFFGAPVFYEHEFDGYAFSESLLDVQLPSANPQLRVMVERHLQSLLDDSLSDTGLSDQIQKIIRRNLGTNTCDIESVAQLLGMHPRAMQRALKSEGLSFRKLLNGVRLSVAQQYLRSSDIRLLDLSDMLGYQNVSAFSRAFKSATGVAPDVWRQQQ